MRTYQRLAAGFALLCAGQALVLADSISPTSFSDSIEVGESTTVRKTVTVSAGAPTSSKVDVFFLADTTGSMGGEIAAVRNSAAAIMASAAGLGDVAFGVGEYKDVDGDPFVYRLNTQPTTVQATVQAGINAWGASGGADFPEANLFALEQVATTTTWRAGSEKILVWFGDAPGHDPRAGSTEASATAALVGQSIAVQAVDVGAMNSTGQALRIANATGGSYQSGINDATIVAAINAAITTAIETYTTVGLDLSEVPAGLTAVAVPASYVGSFDRLVEQTFDFDLTFTGVTPGDYSFAVYGTVDGGRVATETDRITVTDTGTPVPDSGASALLLGLAVAGLGILRRRTA